MSILSIATGSTFKLGNSATKGFLSLPYTKLYILGLLAKLNVVGFIIGLSENKPCSVAVPMLITSTGSWSTSPIFDLAAPSCGITLGYNVASDPDIPSLVKSCSDGFLGTLFILSPYNVNQDLPPAVKSCLPSIICEFGPVLLILPLSSNFVSVVPILLHELAA